MGLRTLKRIDEDARIIARILFVATPQWCSAGSFTWPEIDPS